MIENRKLPKEHNEYIYTGVSTRQDAHVIYVSQQQGNITKQNKERETKQCQQI